MSSHNYILLMAGGAGTRLWPLSRQNRPKQFQKLFQGQSLFQHMMELSQTVVPSAQIFVMAQEDLRSSILEQIPNLPPENIIIEPSRKDNGPAITLGMLEIHRRDPQAVVAILWSDSFVKERDAFTSVLTASFEASTAHPQSLITIGVKPFYPATGFGYIEMEKELETLRDIPLFTVKKFIEKPDYATATTLTKSWKYLWNTGYKIMSSHSFLEQFRQVQPELAPLLEKLENPETRVEAFEQLPKMSIEYMFTEHLRDLIVLPADMGWSDISSWNSLYTSLKNGDDLVTQGPVITKDSHHSLIYAKDRPIVTLGIEDLVIVDEGDVLLIAKKEAAESLKDLLKEVEPHNPELL